MTEDKAKLKYESLNKESHDLHYRAAKKEEEAQSALKEWQNVCSHELSGIINEYGYKRHRVCNKCRLEIPA